METIEKSWQEANSCNHIVGFAETGHGNRMGEEDVHARLVLADGANKERVAADHFEEFDYCPRCGKSTEEIRHEIYVAKDTCG